MSVHTEQVASVLRRAVQEVLSRGLNDPRIRGLISVTAVTVSDDLRQADINVTVIPEEHAELTMHGLRNAAAHIRHEIGGKVRARRVPRLSFRLDLTLKRQAAIEAAIREAPLSVDEPAADEPDRLDEGPAGDAPAPLEDSSR